MSTAEKTTAAPAQRHWLRIALAVVALVELADALQSSCRWAASNLLIPPLVMRQA